MKTLIVLIVMVLRTVSLQAAPNSPTPETDLRQEVKTLLGSPNFEYIAAGTEAVIVFTLNQDNEIVVLDVHTQNQNFERYVKSKLNYQQVSTIVEHSKSRTFTMPIRVARVS